MNQERQSNMVAEEASGNSQEELQNDKNSSESPPPPYYQINQSIIEGSCDNLPPTYEEVQRLKAIEAGLDPCIEFPGNEVIHTSNTTRYPVTVTEINGEIDEKTLGTDLMFFVAFTATFIFNWVGFVLLLCFCHTVAGRCGAIAGFGLSLAKWTVIFRHSVELHDANGYWLLWFGMIIGLLFFAKGILQYINAKKDFARLSSAGPQFPPFP